MTGPSRQVSESVARLLTLDTEPWLSCEDCFRLMDVYVESILADPQTRDIHAMQVHLAACPACTEEAESLLALVGSDSDPSQRDKPTR